MIGPFRGQYRFLSNFYPALCDYEGVIYPTVEHAYQASKTLDANSRKMISESLTAQEAKKLGKHVVIRSDWNEVKLKVMEDLLRLKFSNREVAQLLLLTGSEEIIEVNWWKDTFWGQCNGVGENHLGKLLMKIRDELANELDKRSSPPTQGI